MNFTIFIADAAHEDITRNAMWWAEHHSHERAIQWRDTIYD